MDWTCPRCGSRTYHYDRARIQNRCDGCGCPVEDLQQTQIDSADVGLEES